MMTRIHGKIVFECDECSDLLDTGEGEFQEALTALRDAGWRAHKAGADWCHECDQCRELPQ